MRNLVIVGIDLSGPSNIAETVAVVLQAHGESAAFDEQLAAAGDLDILNLISRLAQRGGVVVGLDAPLSYEPCGGLRRRDRALQSRVMERGMRSGSVMAPTLNRMAYLTLRGLAVARLLASTALSSVTVLEVHPGAAFCLHGAPLESVLAFKRHIAHRQSLLHWLSSQAVRNLPSEEPSDHFVAACGSAFASWMWSTGRAAWVASPEPPLHPFALVC